jgi:hypothetical protein
MSSTATGTRIGIAASLDVNAAGGALVTFVLSRMSGSSASRNADGFRLRTRRSAWRAVVLTILLWVAYLVNRLGAADR